MTPSPAPRRAIRNGSVVTLMRNHSRIRDFFKPVWPSFDAKTPQRAGRIAKAWIESGRLPKGLMQ